MPDDNFSSMRQSIIDGAPDTAAGLAQQAVSSGIAPIDAINLGYVPGMHAVGEQFARGQMYLPDMMASAEAMRAAMAVLDPELKKLGAERPMAGVVVLGTTKGDIHEIGKILVGMLLTAHGFSVHDLGVDVAGETFAAQARELHADIVGVSAQPHHHYAQSEKCRRSTGESRPALTGENYGWRCPRHAALGGRDRRRRLRQRCHERGRSSSPVDGREDPEGSRGACMRPKLQLLDKALIERILEEAFQLIEDPGVRVAPYVVDLLRAAGITVKDGVAHIPEALARRLLDLAPRGFCLYDRSGKPAVRYGGDDVHFDPGSSCLNILDPETQQARPALSADLVRLVQVAEMLPQFAAQSTAMVCNDVPPEIGDWYRLLLVLWYSEKPVVTGAFSASSLHTLLELLAIESGGREALRRHPRAVFDVCPSPPLNWSEFASQNLVDLARAGVPAEIVSMPLAGATAPVTLAGSVVQHAAECISGITIHQLAQPGAPIVWGGAPAIFDMRTGKTPMGAIETAMLDVACAEVGKHLGLPTHAYMVTGDGRVIDAQVGMESGMSTVLGALAGINMISGAGMLDFLACHSIEKLVIDAEAIASAQRLIEGVAARSASLAVAMFAQTGLSGDFLKLKETRSLFRKEQHFPSAVIDRGLASTNGTTPDILQRAHQRVEELLSAYERHPLPPEREQELIAFAQREAKASGLEALPGILRPEYTHN